AFRVCVVCVSGRYSPPVRSTGEIGIGVIAEVNAVGSADVGESRTGIAGIGDAVEVVGGVVVVMGDMTIPIRQGFKPVTSIVGVGRWLGAAGDGESFSFGSVAVSDLPDLRAALIVGR